MYRILNFISWFNVNFNLKDLILHEILRTLSLLGVIVKTWNFQASKKSAYTMFNAEIIYFYKYERINFILKICNDLNVVYFVRKKSKKVQHYFKILRRYHIWPFVNNKF